MIAEQPSFSVGERVALVLDWQWRYDYMQQHTAQHLISGTLHGLFGIGPVSVHFGQEDLIIEIDRGEISVGVWEAV